MSCWRGHHGLVLDHVERCQTIVIAVVGMWETRSFHISMPRLLCRTELNRSGFPNAIDNRDQLRDLCRVEYSLDTTRTVFCERRLIQLARTHPTRLRQIVDDQVEEMNLGCV